MVRKAFAVLAMFALLGAVAGCGGDDDPYRYTFQTYSDRYADGDISDIGIVTQASDSGVTTVLFGRQDSDEYRGFFSFPLDGSTGDTLPSSALVVAADVELFVEGVTGDSSVPIRVDLVSFSTVGLDTGDYSTAALTTIATRTLTIYASDEGSFVRIDVTPLVQEAQRLGLIDAQFRFRYEGSGLDGLVAIYDGSDEGRIPLLTIEYE